MEHFIAGKNYYLQHGTLNTEGRGILYAGPGDVIPMDMAIKSGLVDDPKAKEVPKAEIEDKAIWPAETKRMK
jgi:hypothetical protein